MVDVLVERDYFAKESNELSITKGDIIRDVIQKQGGWWEGTLNDKMGLFPENCVKIIDKDSVVMRNRKDVARIRQCRVVYSYKKEHEDELSLNVGDIIEVLGEEEEGWWRGLLNGKQGVFPSNFVKEVKPEHESRENVSENDSISPILPKKPSKILCEVKYSYKAQNEDELTLKEGDIITLLSKEGQDQGWWRGELDGQIGVFPDNFVIVLNDEKHGTDEKKTSSTKPTHHHHHHHHNYENHEYKAKDSQRKSMENLASEKPAEYPSENDKNKVTPPVPGKKPSIPVKKSPSSGSSGGGGLFYGLKKKIVDVVDGATGSKTTSPPKTEIMTNTTTVSENTDNVFDDVVRRPLLSDVRATRPKAPGRRPPSAVLRESEPGIMNGNTSDHTQSSMEILSEQTTMEVDAAPAAAVAEKPKLREWEKHRAPWLEEMKINQAKRISPGPEAKLKLTSSSSSAVDKETELSTTPPQNKFLEKEPSPEIKPIPAFNSNKLKTPPNELEKPMIRTKTVPTMPTRPQTMQNINLSETKTHLKASPINRTPSPLQKPPTPQPPASAATATHHENKEKQESFEGITNKQYLDVIDRISKLEDMVQQLKEKLKVETEMRIALQAKIEQI